MRTISRWLRRLSWRVWLLADWFNSSPFDTDDWYPLGKPYSDTGEPHSGITWDDLDDPHRNR